MSEIFLYEVAQKYRHNTEKLQENSHTITNLVVEITIEAKDVVMAEMGLDLNFSAQLMLHVVLL